MVQCVADILTATTFGPLRYQVELTDEDVEAAMSIIAFNVTKQALKPRNAVRWSLPPSIFLADMILQARMSFVNQALKGVPSTHHIDLLEKYRAIRKEDVLAAFQKHFIPLFDPASSVAVVVTAPGKAQSIVEGLTGLGFDAARKELGEMENRQSETDSA